MDQIAANPNVFVKQQSFFYNNELRLRVIELLGDLVKNPFKVSRKTGIPPLPLKVHPAGIPP